MKAALAGLGAWVLTGPVGAHGFDERYDLPAPLGYFVTGAVAAVALSFAIAVFFARPAANPPRTRTDRAAFWPKVAHSQWLYRSTQGLGLALFSLVTFAASFGTQDPLMNLAPTFIWIIWWVGLAVVVATVGNVWRALDPWGTLFELLQGAFPALKARPAPLAWPTGLGVWPAVVLLLGWSVTEVIYPVATSPARVGAMIAVWTVISLLGMAGFGREVWQRHADVFAIYFATLAWDTRPDKQAVAGHDAFVMAMLSTVLFDGLHGGQGWLVFEGIAAKWTALAPGSYGLGIFGLVLMWAVFWALYRGACAVSQQPALRYAGAMVPIAVAYNIAHNASSLLIQGQNAVALLSDPMGWGWDVWGTAQFRPNIGLLDAQWTWLIALSAIVAGHAVSIWQTHRVALQAVGNRHQALWLALPLGLLMLAVTAISLLVLAEPLTSFSPP